MEQVKPVRGPYETLTSDPAALRSPDPTPVEVALDLGRSLHDVKTSYVAGEDLVPKVESTDEATAHLVADEAAIAAGPSGLIACIACPAVFLSLRRAHPNRENDLLIDFDPRFQGFGRNTVIVPIDKPLSISQHLPGSLHHKYSVVVADLTYLDPGLIEDILKVSRLLSLLHEPPKVILLALESEEVTKQLTGTALHSTSLKPHGKMGLPVRVYTTIPKPRLLH